jgi:RNA polymerase sigma factor (sigma-70 family)
MQFQTGDFDAALARISKSLGNNSKQAVALQVDEFLGKPPKRSPDFKSKLPRYSPYFPLDAIDSLRKHSEGFSGPTAEEEREFILRFQDPSLSQDEKRATFDLILKSFIRLSIYKSNNYSGTSIPFEEMVQESVFGLYRAAEKWDATLGNRFSTYAIHWIEQSISRFIGDASRTVRLPIHAHEQVRKAKSIARSDFLHGRDFRGMHKVAAELETTAEKLLSLLEADRMTLSLEQFKKNNDFASDEDADELAQHVELVRDLQIALDLLHPREAGVLRVRYGLNGDDPMTLDAIGETFGLTRERIRQIEKKALENLREGALSKKLKAHLGIDVEVSQAPEMSISPVKKTRKKKIKAKPEKVALPKTEPLSRVNMESRKPPVTPEEPSASDETGNLNWQEVVRRTRLALLISRGTLSSEEDELCQWILELSDANISQVLKSAGGVASLRRKLKLGMTLFGDPWS